MNEEKEIFENGTEAESKFGEQYRQGEGHCAPTNPENRFDEAPASVKLPTPEAEATAALRPKASSPRGQHRRTRRLSWCSTMLW